MPLPTPKPPTADGNPPEYNAMKDLAERCAKAEAELERVQKREGAMRESLSLFDCQKFAVEWYRPSEILHFTSRQRNHLLGDQPPIPEDVFSEAFASWMAQQYQLSMLKGMDVMRGKIQEALQPDAGSDYIHKDKTQNQLDAMAAVVKSAYVHKDDARKLVLDKEAIEIALCANGDGLEFRKERCECDPDCGMSPCRYCAIDRVLRKALWAADHAKSIGL